MKLSFAKTAVALAAGLVGLSAHAVTDPVISGNYSGSFSGTSGTNANGSVAASTGNTQTGPHIISIAQWDPLAPAHVGYTLTDVSVRFTVVAGSFSWGVDNDHVTKGYRGGTAVTSGTNQYFSTNGDKIIGGGLSYTASYTSDAGAYLDAWTGSQSTAALSVTKNTGDASNNAYDAGGTDSQNGSTTDSLHNSDWTSVDAAYLADFVGAGTVDFSFLITSAMGKYDAAGLFYSTSGSANGTIEVQYTYTLAVPEPEGYALMLAGLAAMGAMSRRRRLK